MATVSLTFRVPIRRLTRAKKDLTCVRARDDKPKSEWQWCNHRHGSMKTAEKCARSLCLGRSFWATNERVEIRRFFEKE